MASVLDAVRQARSHGRAGEALSLALDAWRGTRNPVVADVVDVLSQEAASSFAAPPARGKAEFQTAWLEVAKRHDPLATGWLAQTLTARLPVVSDHYGILRDDYTRTKYAAWLERLDALAHRPPDPRLAAALCAVLEAPEFSVFDPPRTRPLYAPVVERLLEHADVRCIAKLAPHAERPTAHQQTLRELQRELLPPVLAALRAVAVVEPADLEGWKALVPKVESKPSVSLEAAWHRVLASPDDDDARLVYGDALLESGDPRGEFIALHLAVAKGGASAAVLKRAASLLRTHRRAWLGPLADVLRVGFERGFPARAELAQRAAASPEGWAHAANDERLGTIFSFRLGRGVPKHMALFLRSPAVRHITELELGSFDLVDVLERPAIAGSLETLHLPQRAARKRVVELGRLSLPRLRALSAWVSSGPTDSVFDGLVEAGLLKSVRRLCLRGMMHTLAREAFTWWPRLELDTLSITSDRLDTEQHRFDRTEAGVVYTVNGWLQQSAVELLGRADHGVCEVRLRAAVGLPAERLEQFRQAVVALGLPVAVLPLDTTKTLS